MNATATYIKQRLSLRQPLQESLDIVVQLSNELSLKKNPDLEAALEKVRKHYPTCTDFERDFVSLAFAIATGVGKTRLMGACITYLYLEKNIRNFFILAPNLTLYEKLIEDFGNPNFEKYVFKGIAQFVHNQPIIITGDNYHQQSGRLEESEIRINIFNISKFNRDTKKSRSKKDKNKAPRIKRLSEYLGQSYWQYLTELEDLVILMDEAHRYHADASKKAINELQPVLGLEMTATPIDEKGKTFKNVVYEYSLAQALADGKYVKNPAIAKRKGFKAKGLQPEQIETTKIEDAISIHEDTKNELEIYAKNEGKPLVKPFILVVCRDTTHAKEVFEKMNRADFYGGEYAGKVLQIDSTTKKNEDIERQFLTLEHPDNEIEIVIHVNMLKEGWDVKNLYTIVPLRAANAAVLVEQTIGRGLRLPFGGKRTGIDKLDKLTVVAHENFDSVINAAKDPNSILNKLSFVEIPKEELQQKSKVITSKPSLALQLEEEQKQVNQIKDQPKRQKAQNVLDGKQALITVFQDIHRIRGVKKVEDLNQPAIQEKVIREVKKNLHKGQGNLFANQIVKEAKAVYKSMVTSYKQNIIEIPRMDLVPGEVQAFFKPFDLDTSGFNQQVLEEQIIRMNLKDEQVDTVGVRLSGQYGNPRDSIVALLMDYPEIDYDENADLLYRLTTQACNALLSHLEDEASLRKVVFQFRTGIAQRIYEQMKAHFEVKRLEIVKPNIRPFVKIESWNFSLYDNLGYKDYREIITPKSKVPKHVFRGFEKACHFEYKFDSTPEQDFSFILEHEKLVEKWLRPAPNQLHIYWNQSSQKYEPDFIVETSNHIYMVEIKRSDQMHHRDTLAKKEVAVKYCQYASDYTRQNDGKKWEYVLIPDKEINRTASFGKLIATYR